MSKMLFAVVSHDFTLTNWRLFVHSFARQNWIFSNIRPAIHWVTIRPHTPLSRRLQMRDTIPQLPGRIRLADEGPEYEIIAWTIDGSNEITVDDFDTPFETVAVYGKYMDGVEKQFAAYVEVVPHHLKYFIDAGAANPYIYNAVD